MLSLLTPSFKFVKFKEHFTFTITLYKLLPRLVTKNIVSDSFFLRYERIFRLK